MNIDSLLRDYARQDLKRFTPDAHYWLRDHNPIADRELVQPLLSEPMRFGLTPRERVAATALDSLVAYEIESRAIWATAYPARDVGDTTEQPGMMFNEERKIWGRRESFRASALVYARMLRDEQLIERYQTPEPPPVIDPAPEQQADTPPAPVVEAPASERKAKRTNAFNDVLPYLQAAHRNGKFKTTDEFIRELGKQSGEVDSPFKKATRNDETFYLKSGGQSVSHSVITDRMKFIR